MVLLLAHYKRESVTKKPSSAHRLVNLFSTIFGTDINRWIGDLLAGSGWQVVREEASFFDCTYRVILLKRRSIMRG
jgi:hypothetical protein